MFKYKSYPEPANITLFIGLLSVECGAGWIFDSLENFCYQVVLNSPKTWVKARADCKQKGSDLVSISGRREQNFLQGWCHFLSFIC